MQYFNNDVFLLINHALFTKIYLTND